MSDLEQKCKRLEVVKARVHRMRANAKINSVINTKVRYQQREIYVILTIALVVTLRPVHIA